MKKNKLLAHSIILLLTAQMFFLPLKVTPNTTSTYSETEFSVVSQNQGAEIFSTKIGWKYKTVNGKTYKRLYNYSTGKWIGDWILVS